MKVQVRAVQHVWNAEICRHTTCGVSAGEAACDVVLCRYVPAGDAAEEQGRLGRVVSAARAQRAAPGHRLADREGDPQLRPGRDGGPGRVGPAGVVDLAVPRPRPVRRGVDRGRGGGDPRLPAPRRGVDAGPALGPARDHGGDPPRRRGAAARRRRGGAGDLHPRRPARARTRLEARGDRLGDRTRRHRAHDRVVGRSGLSGHGLPPRRPRGDRGGCVQFRCAPVKPGFGHRVRRYDEHLLRDRGPGAGRSAQRRRGR